MQGEGAVPRRRRSRASRDPRVCPKCGTLVEEPYKTWTLVSPIPDKAGRITITVMGAFECPNCGYKWRAVLSKMKTDGGAAAGDEGDTEEREGQIIEIDLEELKREQLD